MHSESQECDFLVIGSGPAGQKAAIQGAKAGRAVVIVESEPSVGGVCVHKGTIPSKALREAALRVRHVRRILDRDHPVELQPLMNQVDEVIDGHNTYIGDQLNRNGIRRILGRVRFIDEHRVEITRPGDSTIRVTAKFIFIATGSRPRHPPNISVDHEHILDSDSVLALNYLPYSMIVLGGGVIACEYASIFSALGCEVTMIDRYARPLGFLDAEMSDRFVQEFTRAGGEFIGEKNIVSVKTSALNGVTVTLDGGEELRAERLLVAQGRISSLAGLEVESAGVTVSDLGLVPVDRSYRTNVPNIYAIGDVIGPPSLASAAMEQGRSAACHALGLDKQVTDIVIPTGIYAIPEISSVGITEQEAIIRFGNPCIGYAEFREVARGLIAGAEDGMLKLVADPQGEKLLGVHIIGEGATELIHLGQMALINNMSVSVFVDQIFNFPTLAEAYRVAALDIRGQVERGPRRAMDNPANEASTVRSAVRKATVTSLPLK